MANYTVKPGKRAKRLLLEDLAKMERGELGLSDAEKHQMALRGDTAAAQQAGAMQRNIARAGLQTGMSGQAAEAQRNVAKEATEAATANRAAGNDLSARLAEARRQEALGRLDQQRKYKREDIGKVLGKTGEVAKVAGQAIGAAGGGPQ